MYLSTSESLHRLRFPVPFFGVKRVCTDKNLQWARNTFLSQSVPAFTARNNGNKIPTENGKIEEKFFPTLNRWCCKLKRFSSLLFFSRNSLLDATSAIRGKIDKLAKAKNEKRIHSIGDVRHSLVATETFSLSTYPKANNTINFASPVIHDAKRQNKYSRDGGARAGRVKMKLENISMFDARATRYYVVHGFNVHYIEPNRICSHLKFARREKSVHKD